MRWTSGTCRLSLFHLSDSMRLETRKFNAKYWVLLASELLNAAVIQTSASRLPMSAFVAFVVSMLAVGAVEYFS